MAKSFIKAELEFFDVLNAFPALRDILTEQKFDISKIEEGISIQSYLEKQNMSQKEIDIFIKRINLDLNNFLCGGTCEVLQIKPETAIETVNYDEFEKLEEEE